MLIQTINDRFLIREPEQLYELQFSSFSIPPSLYNFQCYPHLEKMRESYAFVLYFVFADSLFYFVPIIVCTFSLVRFVQELKKSLDFQRRAANTAATATSANRKQRAFWNVSRSVFILDTVTFLLALLVIICFTIYWLVVDPDAVFLFETVHYLSTFFTIVISLYFFVRKIGILAKIANSLYDYFAARSARTAPAAPATPAAPVTP